MSSYFIRQFNYVLLVRKVCQIAFKWWPSWAGGTWSLPGWCAFYVALLGRRDFLHNEEANFSLLFLLFLGVTGHWQVTKTQRSHVVFLNFPFLTFKCILYVWVFVCMCLCVTCVLPGVHEGQGGGIGSLGTGVNGHWWVTMWVLVIEPLSSGKAVRTFNCGIVSPAYPSLPVLTMCFIFLFSSSQFLYNTL